MKRVAVLTSGGDAPGMNAAIRAVVRTGVARGWEVFGVPNGYAGLLEGRFLPLGARDVGGIIQQGGTVLGSARSTEFRTGEGQARAIEVLLEQRIDGLVVVGGNGSQTGAYELSKRGFPVVGVASTVDNDLLGCDITLGADTALNVALEAIDRLKITAASHHRVFAVEVMGRDSGYLALMAAIAGGAEVAIIPEVEVDPEQVVRHVQATYRAGKRHALIVAAEGARYNAAGLRQYVEEHHAPLGMEFRTTTLGHVQRGGAPGAFDRLLATRLGAAAAEQLAEGRAGVLVGLLRGEIRATPLAEVAGRTKALDLSLLELARVLTI
ncbi:MAG TPA: ATP-dependent 6-phosphofructokinase [Longimicrobiales bacterium]|nr:ATP-dependent 6-phosphofructokinase [Longimicrobiales bacterium]